MIGGAAGNKSLLLSFVAAEVGRPDHCLRRAVVSEKSNHEGTKGTKVSRRKSFGTFEPFVNSWFACLRLDE
jgi:hypothetical protein